MRVIRGLLVFPLLWAMRKLHIGDGWHALSERPTREELRQQLVEHLQVAQEYENPESFWKSQK